MTDRTTTSGTPQIELRITTPWHAPEEFVAAMKAGGAEYELDERYFIHKPTGWKCELGASPHDDEIADLFAHDGRLSVKELREIDDHAAKVHLIAPGGSRDAVRDVLAAAAAVLRAGASGVMVDNSGATHGKRDFLKLAGDAHPGGAYWAVVALNRGKNDEIFSVGMQCLGLKDAEMPEPPPDPNFAAFLIHNFLGYTYQSGKTILDGDPIGDAKGATHRARHYPCHRFKPDTPFYNPYGIWRLKLMEQDDD